MDDFDVVKDLAQVHYKLDPCLQAPSLPHACFPLFPADPLCHEACNVERSVWSLPPSGKTEVIIRFPKRYAPRSISLKTRHLIDIEVPIQLSSAPLTTRRHSASIVFSAQRKEKKSRKR